MIWVHSRYWCIWLNLINGGNIQYYSLLVFNKTYPEYFIIWFSSTDFAYKVLKKKKLDIPPLNYPSSSFANENISCNLKKSSNLQKYQHYFQEHRKVQPLILLYTVLFNQFSSLIDNLFYSTDSVTESAVWSLPPIHCLLSLHLISIFLNFTFLLA